MYCIKSVKCSRNVNNTEIETTGRQNNYNNYSDINDFEIFNNIIIIFVFQTHVRCIVVTSGVIIIFVRVYVNILVCMCARARL